MTDNNHTTVRPISRRRFVQGIAAAGALLSASPMRGGLAATPAPVLSGTEFQLEIGPVPVKITGRPMIGTAINGQIPAPIRSRLPSVGHHH